MSQRLPEARAELDRREHARGTRHDEFSEAFRPLPGSPLRGGWLSNLRRHGRGRRASGSALKAELSLIGAAASRARRLGKMLAAYRYTWQRPTSALID